MFTESEIRSFVSDSIKNTLTSENTPITEALLTEIITKSISSCLLSDDFINYLDEKLGELCDQAERSM